MCTMNQLLLCLLPSASLEEYGSRKESHHMETQTRNVLEELTVRLEWGWSELGDSVASSLIAVLIVNTVVHTLCRLPSVVLSGAF